MRQLEAVHLGWCTSVTDADVRALARLPSLRELDLARTLVGLALHTWLLRSPPQHAHLQPAASAQELPSRSHVLALRCSLCLGLPEGLHSRPDAHWS